MKRRRRLQFPGRAPRHARLAQDALLHLLSRYDQKGGLKLVRLWRRWDAVVGPEVAELARPIGHKDGALLLAAEDSVAAQQLSYFAPELLEKVNAFFGEEIFDKVRFELLSGRTPLTAQEEKDDRPTPAGARAEGPLPPQVGALADRVDPNTAAGRCYLAYAARYQAAKAAQAAAADEENIRPARASRRRK